MRAYPPMAHLAAAYGEHGAAPSAGSSPEPMRITRSHATSVAAWSTLTPADRLLASVGRTMSSERDPVTALAR